MRFFSFSSNLSSETAFPFSSSCYWFFKQAITTGAKFQCVSIIYRSSFLKKQHKLQRCALKPSTTRMESATALSKTPFLNAHRHFPLFFCAQNLPGAFFAHYNHVFYTWSQSPLSSSMKSELRWQSNVPLTSLWRSRIILLFLSISVFKKFIYNFKEMLSGSCWDVIVNTIFLLCL